MPPVAIRRDEGVIEDSLALIDSLPYFSECERASYRMLQLGPGMTVLDAGCGPGDDTPFQQNPAKP